MIEYLILLTSLCSLRRVEARSVLLAFQLHHLNVAHHTDPVIPRMLDILARAIRMHRRFSAGKTDNRFTTAQRYASFMAMGIHDHTAAVITTFFVLRATTRSSVHTESKNAYTSHKQGLHHA